MFLLNFRFFTTAMCLLFCFSEFSLHASENQDKAIQEKKDGDDPRFRMTSSRRSEKEPKNFASTIKKVKEEKLYECNGNDILDWFYDVQTAIYENNDALVRRLASQNHNCANMLLSGEEKTLLMYALERPNPSFSVIQELLNLHFDLTFVPNHPNHTVLSYYEEFYPNILTQEGMDRIINLLMNHRWRVYAIVNGVKCYLYVSLSDFSTTSSAHSSPATFSLDSIVSTMVRFLTRSKKSKGAISTISFSK